MAGLTKFFNYKHTVAACMAGYIVQAAVNNFVPLLLLTFQQEFAIPLYKITLLITVNFAIQLTVDLLSSFFIDKIGYKAAAVGAHIFAAAGFILLAVLPTYVDPFAGIAAAVSFYAVGGGLIEVVISPIVEACPTDGKEKAMSLLHSFYCWGTVAVIGLSTLFFATAGIAKWRILSLAFAIVPILNALFFAVVPIAPLDSEGKRIPLKKLLTDKTFWLAFLLMICAGAAEQSVSQWASFFAERGLGIDKTLGDVFGPMAFAVAMGTSRLIYGKFGEKIKLEKFMLLSGVLCVAAYLVASLSPEPVSALIAVMVIGFSVGIMWPGTFSISAKNVSSKGTAMFALLALAGDLGCTAGPTLVGFASDAFSGNLGLGLLTAVAFPAVFLAGVAALMIFNRKKDKDNLDV